jgi:hypothetical protein
MIDRAGLYSVCEFDVRRNRDELIAVGLEPPCPARM